MRNAILEGRAFKAVRGMRLWVVCCVAALPVSIFMVGYSLGQYMTRENMIYEHHEALHKERRFHEGVIAKLNANIRQLEEQAPPARYYDVDVWGVIKPTRSAKAEGIQGWDAEYTNTKESQGR
jgi:hypothetical protein